MRDIYISFWKSSLLKLGSLEIATPTRGNINTFIYFCHHIKGDIYVIHTHVYIHTHTKNIYVYTHAKIKNQI